MTKSKEKRNANAEKDHGNIPCNSQLAASEEQDRDRSIPYIEDSVGLMRAL